MILLNHFIPSVSLTQEANSMQHLGCSSSKNASRMWDMW